MYVYIYTTLGFHAGNLRVFFYRGSFLTTEHDPGAVAAGTAVLLQQKGWQGTVVTPTSAASLSSLVAVLP